MTNSGHQQGANQAAAAGKLGYKTIMLGQVNWLYSFLLQNALYMPLPIQWSMHCNIREPNIMSFKAP